MKNLKLIITLISVFALTLLLSSCSQFYHKNDAVRIMIDSAHKYSKNPYTATYRNGSTLRGTVIKVLKTTQPDSCPTNKFTKLVNKSYVVFVDSLSKNEEKIELIPLEDVVLIGREEGIPRNEWDNINLFENYNNPAGIRELRAVPVDSAFVNECDRVCECLPIDITLPGIEFDCPPRYYPWFFAELRAGYAVYNDELNNESIGRQSFMGELAFGLRMGQHDEWGLGMAYNYGINLYNSYTGTDIKRSAVMLHGRWQSSESKFLGMCMKPFLYGQLGLSVDELSMDLTSFYFNDDCQSRMTAYLPLINLSLPISAGFGVGLDIPVTPILDISFDIGFRSVTYGETILVGGVLAPTGRNVNMFIARAGITF